MESEIVKHIPPKPPTIPMGPMTARKREKVRMGWEMAAMAYVQMENDEYVYPEGAFRQGLDKDGKRKVNHAELMRRAGYRGSSLERFNDFLGSKPEFWELVELYRVRRTDPMFRSDQSHLLWAAIGERTLQLLYEQVMYYPHTMTVTEKTKILDSIVKAGIQLGAIGGDEEKGSKASQLLDKLPPAERDKAMEGYRDQLQAELNRIERLKKAHAAADRE